MIKEFKNVHFCCMRTAFIKLVHYMPITEIMIQVMYTKYHLLYRCPICPNKVIKFIPYRLMKHKKIIQVLDPIGFPKYDYRQYYGALKAGDFKFIKKLYKHCHKFIPDDIIYSYITEIIPFMSTVSFSQEEAIRKCNLTDNEKRILKFLFKHLKTDKDLKAKCYLHLNIPLELAYE